MTNYEDIKSGYKGPYSRCGKLGRIVDRDTGKIVDIPCNKWPCEICRPKLKYQLYLEILKNVYMFDLQRHFVITFGGSDIRRKISLEDSYKYMSNVWNKYKQVIQYHYGYFDYILLARSQKSGYCHYHIIMNKYIPWEFLDEKRKKYDLGFVSIQKNKNVAEYLNTDFFDDNEWKIPFGVRHYSSSRNIVLNNCLSANFNRVFVEDGISIDKIVEFMKTNFGICPNVELYYEQKFLDSVMDRQGLRRFLVESLYKTFEEHKQDYIDELREKKELDNEIRSEIIKCYCD